MTFVEVSVFLKGQPVKTTSLDPGLNHMQLLYCYVPTWQVHLRAVGLVLGVWLYMERSCPCCCLCFFGSVSQRTPVTMWWHNTELCDTGSLQAGFDFFYRLVRQSNLSVYVTCHTCHHFISSLTAKKFALQFCIPLPEQMVGIARTAGSNVQKFAPLEHA